MATKFIRATVIKNGNKYRYTFTGRNPEKELWDFKNKCKIAGYEIECDEFALKAYTSADAAFENLLNT